MKRIYVLFAAVLGLALALTACGSSGSSGGTAAGAAFGTHPQSWYKARAASWEQL